MSGNQPRHAIAHLHAKIDKLVLTKMLKNIVVLLVCIQKSQQFPVSGKLDFGQSEKLQDGGGEVNNLACGPKGCNATTNNNNSVEISVQVRTKVNLDQVKEEVPDVPIFIGRDSTTQKNHRYGQDGEVLNINNIIQQARPSHYGYRPPNRLYPATTTTRYYYGPPQYPTTIRPVVRRIYYPATPQVYSYSYSNNYGESRVQVNVPYYEHTYNKHYFGEEPPPPNVWYGRSDSYNPVEFPTNNKWRPAGQWNGRTYLSKGAECSCKEIPAADSLAYASNTKKVEIDDKLAPLN